MVLDTYGFCIWILFLELDGKYHRLYEWTYYFRNDSFLNDLILLRRS